MEALLIQDRAALGAAATVDATPQRATSTPPVPARSRFRGRRAHFIGIGGSGMNGLARMLLDCGGARFGSEPQPHPQTSELAGLGAVISPSQDGRLLTPSLDLVVRTAAVR